MVAAPAGGLLYSLLHLSGYPGDLQFYSRHAKQCVLELGAGDGRLAAALCDGQRRYVGIEIDPTLSAKAASRVAADGNAEVRTADFFVDELPAGVDTAILSSNVLFSTPRHAELLGRCADALAPGGVLLLDVYNALLYLQDGEPDGAAGGDDDMLVRVTDELGRDWTCFERDPTIDTERQRISQPYEFVSGGETFQETLVHNYLLPEELSRALDDLGLTVDSTAGAFDGGAFDADESEHLVVVATKR